MGVAMLLITWGLQQALTAAQPYVGGAAVVIGLVVAIGYQYVEDSDHKQVYTDLVTAIGEDNLKELSQLSAEEIRKLRQEVTDEG